MFVVFLPIFVADNLTFYTEYIQVSFAIGNNISHNVTSFKSEGSKDLISKFIDEVNRLGKVTVVHVRKKY